MAEDNTCWECGKTLVQKNVDYSLYGIHIGKFPARVCTKCNETLFAEEISKKITEKVKEKGLWGLRSTTKIGQAGSTLDVRLNKKIIDFMNLQKGKEVTVYPESKNKLVISL
jgi:hypothetical protein|tara:strand:- start:45 stop:380 length:336 start_codon:yes stop_codon:yes gene_type:complete